MTIEMTIRETTLYTIPLPGDRSYETFDYDKARQMQGFMLAGVPAAECVDCKAVVPVALVDRRTMGKPGRDDITLTNECPATTSRNMTGHRVSREAYETAQRGA